MNSTTLMAFGLLAAGKVPAATDKIQIAAMASQLRNPLGLFALKLAAVDPKLELEEKKRDLETAHAEIRGRSIEIETLRSEWQNTKYELAEKTQALEELEQPFDRLRTRLKDFSDEQIDKAIDGFSTGNAQLDTGLKEFLSGVKSHVRQRGLQLAPAYKASTAAAD